MACLQAAYVVQTHELANASGGADRLAPSTAVGARRYQPLLGVRIKSAFEKAFAACADKDRTRLHHVLRTWTEKFIFAEHVDELNSLVAPWCVSPARSFL